MERTLKVTGKGKVSVKPDRVCLAFGLEGARENYDEVLRLSAERTECLRECFGKLGFDRAELKTVSFHVNTKYEQYQDEDRLWKKKFAGYEFRHSLKLEFGADSGRMGSVLYAAAHSAAEPEIYIQYTVGDVEEVRNRLIGQAVEDSRRKAEILAEAAGVRLKEVLTVEYSWDGSEGIAGPMNQMREASRGAVLAAEADGVYDCGMEPEDIEVSDRVAVVWAIE